MSYTLHQTEGIVFAMWPRSEADRLFRLYTEHYGSVTLVAKGVRLEKSKLRGDMELFSKTSIGFVAGKEIYRLTHAQVTDTYVRIREDYDRYRTVGFIADMMRSGIADGEQDAHLWNLLGEAFAFLNSEGYARDYLQSFLCTFELRFFRCLGYLPQQIPRAAEELLAADAFLPDRVFTSSNLQELSVFLQSIRRYTAINGGYELKIPR